MRTEEQQRAFNDGWKSGHADRLLGYLSRYAWYGTSLDPVESYAFHYSLGYQTGFNAGHSLSAII